jgi:hypothetical protein
MSTSATSVNSQNHALEASLELCEAAIFHAYEVKLCSPNGNMIPDWIESEFELYKEGKHDVYSLFDFLDTIDLDPEIPSYIPTLYLASLFIGDVLDTLRAQQRNSKSPAAYSQQCTDFGC